MLGEKIGDLTGNVTGAQVLPGDDYRYVKMDISYQWPGNMLGMDAMDVGTFAIFERVPGHLYSDGMGVSQA